MNKKEFYAITEKLILPLFTGSYISGEEVSSSRDNEVAYGKHNSLLIKPNKVEEYRLVLRRGQPFKTFELNLLKSIVSEMNDIAELNIADENYVKKLQAYAIEKAICSSICEDDTSSTLIGVVNELSKWASRTYEGKKVTLGLIINEASTVGGGEGALHYNEIFSKDFFSLLSDGKKSFVEFSKDGYLLGYVQLSKIRAVPTIAPHEFDLIARYCNDRRVGIILTENGEVLIFKNRQLLFSKRRGIWNVYSHEEAIQLLSYRGSYSSKDIRKAIYYTALDCSYAYSGGILVYLNKDMVDNALMHINAHDILDEKYYEIKKKMELENASKLYNLQNLSSVEALYSVPFETFLKEQRCYKSQCLRKIINGKPFYELNRKLRQELVAMDGATIIDFDGTIVAVGAILKIEAGSESGGRLAATTTLAKYGNSIKISQDGIIQAFFADRKTGKLKNLFNVG